MRRSVMCLRIECDNLLLVKLALSCEKAKIWSWASREENIHFLWAISGVWGYCVLLSELVSSLLLKANQLKSSKGQH